MIKYLLLFFCCFCFISVNSQISFTEHVLPLNSSLSLNTINFSDIDGDGDQDILTSHSSNSGTDKIFWHENLDGLGTFGPEILINDDARDPLSPITGDFNGDGYMDMAAISFQTTRHIYWQENTDGSGDFGVKITIDTPLERPREIISADIDNDGDLDLILVCGSLSSSSVDDNVILYKNDGSGVFTKIVVATNDDLTTVNICDIDGDDDLDIIAGNFYDGNAYWYENINGLGDFGPGNQFSTTNYITSLDFGDIDNDGDIDIILSSNNDYNVIWYENTDGLGTFTEHTIGGYNQEESSKVLAVDVNNDGKLDIVSQKEADEDIVWYENTDGLGVFSEAQIIHEELFDIKEIIATDFNGDGLTDIGAISSPGAVNLAWYENMGLGSNKIQGYVTVDSDLDGCDDSDIVISNMMVVADNGSETYASFTLSNGFYALYPQEGNYTTSLSSPYLTYYNSNPESYTDDFPGIGTVVTNDFCMEPISTFNDLQVSIYPMSDAVPGFQANYRIVFKNVGSTILSGDVSFLYNEEKLSFLNASEAIASQASNSLTFNYIGLYPFEIRYMDVSFDVFTPPTNEIDDILSFTATINPIAEDSNEEDNTFNYDQIIVGSYDPNDIRVMEGDEIFIEDADEYLHYIIRFQNTGTAPAINVMVETVLDEKLDWTTMQLESLSHEGRVEINNFSNVNFIFNDINLPDSNSNEPNSHGFIAYKIKPKSDVVLGDIFNASADIFFDFNPAIVTNTASTEIVANLSVDEFSLNPFLVYPNPAEKELVIKGEVPIKSMRIFDINGRSLISKKITDLPLKYKFDVSNLSKGVYYIEIKSEDSEHTQKFIKK